MQENNKVSKWLARLQENSWEPEIFISGIILFSLFQIPAYLDEYAAYIDREIDLGNNAMLIFGIVDVGIYWLIVGFVFHLFTRGIWTSLIGLSFVFPKGINRSNLRYAPKFENKVRNIPPLEVKINQLEKLSSAIFSISFLLFMSMIAVTLWFCFLLAVIFSMLQILGINRINSTSGMLIPAIVMVILITSFIYLIDFISLGIFKKNKVIATIFAPIHWFFSKLALSGLYANIYYIYISNVKKWKIVIALLIYIIVSIGAVTWHVSKSIVGSNVYYSGLDMFTLSREHFTSDQYYQDKNSDIPPEISIQSDVIDENVLKLFIEHKRNYELFFKDSCSLGDAIDTIANVDEKAKAIKHCLSQFYHVYIDDTLVANLDFVFYKNEKFNQKGFLNWIDIGHLEKGIHQVKVQGSLSDRIRFRYFVPFYKSIPKSGLKDEEMLMETKLSEPSP